MTSDLTSVRADSWPAERSPRPLRLLVPGVAAVLFAGVQLQAGLVTASYREISPVATDRLNFPYSGSMAVVMSLGWGLAQALFVVSLIGFARSGATGTSRIGRFGSWVVVAGGVVFVAAQVLSAILGNARADDQAALVAVVLFAVGSLFSAVGFLLAGGAVLRVRRWTSWRRLTPLAVGASMLCVVPLQFTSLLAVAVTAYAATILAFGVALLAEPRDQPA